MPNLKITLIGGGSYAWTPGVLANLLTNRRLGGSAIVLHDLNPEALALTHRLGRMYLQKLDVDAAIDQTTDQAAALDGADYVIVTISTGGLQTMRADIEIPEKYGILQTVGDTVGPGGLSRALRNIPVFLQMARAMEQRCPNAWMLNLSNPLSTITRAVNKQTGVRALGLCHGVLGVAMEYAEFLGADLSECAYINTGMDHCSWFTEFNVRGRRLRDLLDEKGLDRWLSLPPVQAQEDPTFGKLHAFRCGFLLGRALGALPAIHDRHMVEFFPTFLQGPENVERYGLARTSMDDRERYYLARRARIERWLSGEEEVHLQVAGDVAGRRQSDDLGAWISALEGWTVFEDNLNAPNIGQIPELPLGPIVETRGLLDGAGYHPLASPMPAQLQAVIHPHVTRQELTVQAAVEGDFDKALAVLAADPLLEHVGTARPMLEEMMTATKEWLPQFGCR